MKNWKKALRGLLRWETMLVVLLVVLCVVFEARDDAKDAVLIAKGKIGRASCRE